MSKKHIPKPTDAELEILQIMWKYGPSTVRFVNDKRSEKMKVGYTTTLKLMQIMTEKKLVKRNEKNRTHVYIPVYKEEETKHVLLDKFLETVFEGSATNLVMQTIGHKKTSAEELKEIKKIISKMERDKK